MPSFVMVGSRALEKALSVVPPKIACKNVINRRHAVSKSKIRLSDRDLLPLVAANQSFTTPALIATIHTAKGGWYCEMR